MADFKQTAYQADVLKHFGNTDSKTNIFYNLPDQFTQYENRSYNPIDFLTNSGEFNLDLINKSYREEQLKRMKHFRQLELQRLAREPQPIPTPLDMTLGQNIIQFQQTFFDIVTDTTDGSKPFEWRTLMSTSRLFYIGIGLVLIFVIYASLNSIRMT